MSNKLVNLNKTSTSGEMGGFTIVELLVVIVVIGILAAITIVSYTGINKKAVAASMQSDLTNASTQLKMFQVDNGAYPATIDCGQADSTTNKCIKSSSGNSYNSSYAVNNSTNPQTFSLVSTNTNGTQYSVTSSTPPAVTIFYDDFSRADGTLGANWSAGKPQIVSGKMQYNASAGDSTPGFQPAVAGAAGSNLADVSASAIFRYSQTPAGTRLYGQGPFIRTNVGSTQGYIAMVVDGVIMLQTIPTYTTIGSPASVAHTMVDGDVVTLKGVGNKISVLLNGVQIISATDSSAASGYVGLVPSWYTGTGGIYDTPAHGTWDNFTVEAAS